MMLVLVTSPLTAFATVASPTDVDSAVTPPLLVTVTTRVTVSVTVVHAQPFPQGPPIFHKTNVSVVFSYLSSFNASDCDVEEMVASKNTAPSSPLSYDRKPKQKGGQGVRSTLTRRTTGASPPVPAGPAGPDIAVPLAARDGVDAAGPGAGPLIPLITVVLTVAVPVLVARTAVPARAAAAATATPGTAGSARAPVAGVCWGEGRICQFNRAERGGGSDVCTWRRDGVHPRGARGAARGPLRAERGGERAVRDSGRGCGRAGRLEAARHGGALGRGAVAGGRRPGGGGGRGPPRGEAGLL